MGSPLSGISRVCPSALRRRTADANPRETDHPAADSPALAEPLVLSHLRGSHCRTTPPPALDRGLDTRGRAACRRDHAQRHTSYATTTQPARAAQRRATYTAAEREYTGAEQHRQERWKTLLGEKGHRGRRDTGRPAAMARLRYRFDLGGAALSSAQGGMRRPGPRRPVRTWASPAIACRRPLTASTTLPRQRRPPTWPRSEESALVTSGLPGSSPQDAIPGENPMTPLIGNSQ